MTNLFASGGGLFVNGDEPTNRLHYTIISRELKKLGVCRTKAGDPTFGS
jgi:hypothetical protein